MASILDSIYTQEQSKGLLAQLAEQLTRPARIWGWGRTFEMIQLHGQNVLVEQSSASSIAEKVMSVALAPISAIATAVGACLNQILRYFDHNVSEHFDTPIAISYPSARRGDHVDTYHGTQVADPYRWLEDPQNPERLEWIERERELANEYLSGLDQREALHQKLEKLWNFERMSCPYKQGGHYFWTANNGLQNQSPLYVTDSLSHEPRVLLDPNTLSGDGTDSLAGYDVSPDGKYLAYAISQSGSDWNTIRVRDVATGEDLADEVSWVKFSDLSWMEDSSGFFFSRYEAPEEGKELQENNENHKIFFHAIETPQNRDLLIFEDPDEPNVTMQARVSEDGQYLIITGSRGCETDCRVSYLSLSEPSAGTQHLLPNFDASYEFIGNVGDEFYFVTDKEAPKKRVVAIDLSQPSPENWREIIPEREEILHGACIVGGKLLLDYLKDVHSQAEIFDLDGQFLHELPLPGVGCLASISGQQFDSELFYQFTGFTSPGTVYRYDLDSQNLEVHHTPQCGFNPDDFETKQVFYASKDGTRVPMFINHKKGIELDGENPCILYGYGGFDISIPPNFSPTIVAWMEQGGVYCVANLRGGGEYGKEWHEAGMKLNKQNVFDDFIAAGEHLIENGYTKSSKLGIFGGSNGGLMVGACLNQRPDLFGAGAAAVGVMDMLRFNQFTIGKAWESDYGSPENPEEFQALLAYSPYHNIRDDVAHPATLVMTSDHDDRVVPLHSYKYTAALQHAERFFSTYRPHIIRIASNTGHGAGRSTAEKINEVADLLGFFSQVLQ